MGADYHVEAFTAEEQRLLAPHVTNLDRPVFALTNLPQVTAAALFALRGLAGGREAEPMLFKTQMGFASKSIRIGLDSSLKVFDLSPRIAPEGGAR